MRFLSADFIFPISSEPIKNGVLAVDANGIILDVFHPDTEGLPDNGSIEKFNGILCPGFINAHCHLELSHMKGVVSENSGLPDFLTDIISKRDENAELKAEAIRAADKEMWLGGIQAVGDICNTADTVSVKSESKIYYHSFVEVFSMDPKRSKAMIKEGIGVAKEYRKNGLSASIVPHAPYSVFEELYGLIREQQESFPGTVSIHNQETESEDEMFVSGTGALMHTFQNFGTDFSHHIPNGKSSLRNSLPQLPTGQNILLVHNTCTSASDLDYAHSLRNNIFWCTCPHANQYIEQQIPNIPMWLERNATVCVGTDSLASNHQLSVLDELKLIQQHYPEIGLATLLAMATLNGAKALQLEKEIGSFQRSRKPGAILLKNIDLLEMRFTQQCKVERIV